MLFYLVIAALLVPITAITLPLYLVYAKVHLINSIWGMILPSMVSPVGVYLMKVFVEAVGAPELIDAARIDGAGELRIFCRLALPLMVPGLMTVLLLSVVAVWNNYFLPLIIFSQNQLYPLTVGLGLWSQRAQNSGNAELFPLVVTRRAGHHRAADRAVPDPAAVLAQRPAARQHRELRKGAPVAASVTLDELTKVYANGVTAVRDLDLHVGDGRVRRAGRPVRLRQDHRAAHGGRAWSRSPRARSGSATGWSTTCSPRQRDVAMVFQNYALYPHLTVAENIGFCAGEQENAQAERDRRVREAAADPRPRPSC